MFFVLEIREGAMQTFSILFASLGVLVALVYFLSVWTAFGIVYMLSILSVVVVAFFRRSGEKVLWKRAPVGE